MSASHPITSLDQNKQLVIRWFEEVWNQGNRDTISEAPLHPMPYSTTVDRIIRGPAEFEKFYDRLRAVFSNFKISPVLALAEGDPSPAFTGSRNVNTSPPARTAQITGTSIVRHQGRPLRRGLAKLGTPPAWPPSSPISNPSRCFRPSS